MSRKILIFSRTFVLLCALFALLCFNIDSNASSTQSPTLSVEVCTKTCLTDTELQQFATIEEAYSFLKPLGKGIILIHPGFHSVTLKIDSGDWVIRGLDFPERTILRPRNRNLGGYSPDRRRYELSVDNIISMFELAGESTLLLENLTLEDDHQPLPAFSELSRDELESLEVLLSFGIYTKEQSHLSINNVHFIDWATSPLLNDQEAFIKMNNSRMHCEDFYGAEFLRAGNVEFVENIFENCHLISVFLFRDITIPGEVILIDNVFRNSYIQANTNIMLRGNHFQNFFVAHDGVGISELVPPRTFPMVNILSQNDVFIENNLFEVTDRFQRNFLKTLGSEKDIIFLSGVYITNGGEKMPLIQNNTFRNLASGIGVGIFEGQASQELSISLTGNTFENTNYGLAIHAFEGDEPPIVPSVKLLLERNVFKENTLCGLSFLNYDITKTYFEIFGMDNVFADNPQSVCPENLPIPESFESSSN